ncbi:MBL fold metallo-hydrolase [Lacibacter sediminis]|uniref:MBL fold metallo-hydrolase n=2 Tax=Lacibacter sediminis TaxID=2760713 RepID=A0A7G5XMJ6_9BACT|nr:MBL fold metallo-hydrolase [Lacibacter sediminis]
MHQTGTITRGQFLRFAGIITAGLTFAPREIFAQESPVTTIIAAAAKDPVIVQLLRGNIHLLEGSGGNIAVFDGPEGKLMVDAGISVSQKKIMASLSKISTKPTKYLINTHWHFDHADGNEWVHNTGATIIAHANTKKNLSKTITVKDWNYTFKPHTKAGLPTVVFQKEHTLKFNGSAIQLRYYPPAHTDSDISVYFPSADVLHVGDTWWNAHYPFIDHDSGGNLDGMINACTQNLAMSTDKTLIIPGHGAVGNRTDLLEYRDMLVSVKEHVSKLKKSGMSLNATIDAKPTKVFDSKFGNFVLNGAFFTKLVYADV